MKILFVIDTIQGSGAERSLVEIALHFTRHTPVFVHVYEGDMLRPLLEDAGIKVYSLHTPDPRNFSKAAKNLAAIYEEEKPDIIHSTLFRSDAITRKLKKKYSIPLVSSFVNNSYNPLRFKNQSLSSQIKLRLVQLYDTYTSRRVNFFISNSETIKHAKAKSTLVPFNKVKVIYRGRDVQKFDDKIEKARLVELKESLGIKNQKVILNVSRLIERKGQMDMIEAMPQILEKFPDTILFIAGHGVFKEKLEQRAVKLGIKENVMLLGRRMDVPNLLAIANIFVYPSYFEGLPGALIEAMMAKKIIISSNIPENLECVNEESAIIFERGNVADLSNKVNFALQNEESLTYLGENAKRTAVKKFDIRNVAKEYEMTYDELIDKMKN